VGDNMSADAGKIDMIRNEVNERLRQSSDGVNMDIAPTVLSSKTVYRGAIFHVDDMSIALKSGNAGVCAGQVAHVESTTDLDRGDGASDVVIRRQVVRHADSVVMLVHDEDRDRYLVEREYRVGPGGFVYGLPAGLIDGNENTEAAALRELCEETGIEPEEGHTFTVEPISSCYLSEGMTGERSHVFAVRLGAWRRGERHFDPDEHVQSAWVAWDELVCLGFKGAQAIIALQYEELRRLRAGLIS
jgi:ADP-ribose pyrophosphatase